MLSMLTSTYSGAVSGVEGLVIRVEVDFGTGMTSFRMVGLPDAAVREAQVRVRLALANSGFGKCEGTTTVNLAPADVKKQGSGFDLALEQSPLGRLEDTLFLGELALNGDLRHVRGVLSVVSQAVQKACPASSCPKTMWLKLASEAGIPLVPYLQKPFTTMELLKALDDLCAVTPDAPAPTPEKTPAGRIGSRN